MRNQCFQMNFRMMNAFAGSLVLALLLAGCAQEAPKPSGVKRLQAGQASGFLKDYEALKPHAELGGEALVYVNPDQMKDLHRYVAIIVDPVEVFVSTSADDSKIPPRASEVIANYFRRALENAVGDAFPIVETPGPLVLRLRAAVVGIDLGGPLAPAASVEDPNKTFSNAIVLEKVGIEVELIDSDTGERIAALVDRTPLGAGAEVGSEQFSREARFAEGRQAFDGWAGRLRQFLDAEHELKGEAAKRADEAYRAYGQ